MGACKSRQTNTDHVSTAKVDSAFGKCAFGRREAIATCIMLGVKKKMCVYKERCIYIYILCVYIGATFTYHHRYLQMCIYIYIVYVHI